MKVYRVELPAAAGGWIGPYQTSSIEDEAYVTCEGMAMSHTFSHRHPVPPVLHGWIGPETEHYYCGCPSMRALFSWFGGYLPQLRRLGARVVVLDVPDERVKWSDGSQVVFDMGHKHLKPVPEKPKPKPPASQLLELVTQDVSSYRLEGTWAA